MKQKYAIATLGLYRIISDTERLFRHDFQILESGIDASEEAEMKLEKYQSESNEVIVMSYYEPIKSYKA